MIVVAMASTARADPLDVPALGAKVDLPPGWTAGVESQMSYVESGGVRVWLDPRQGACDMSDTAAMAQWGGFDVSAADVQTESPLLVAQWVGPVVAGSNSDNAPEAMLCLPLRDGRGLYVAIVAMSGSVNDAAPALEAIAKAVYAAPPPPAKPPVAATQPAEPVAAAASPPHLDLDQVGLSLEDVGPWKRSVQPTRLTTMRVYSAAMVEELSTPDDLSASLTVAADVCSGGDTKGFDESEHGYHWRYCRGLTDTTSLVVDFVRLGDAPDAGDGAKVAQLMKAIERALPLATSHRNVDLHLVQFDGPAGLFADYDSVVDGTNVHVVMTPHTLSLVSFPDDESGDPCNPDFRKDFDFRAPPGWTYGSLRVDVSTQAEQVAGEAHFQESLHLCNIVDLTPTIVDVYPVAQDQEFTAADLSEVAGWVGTFRGIPVHFPKGPPPRYKTLRLIGASVFDGGGAYGGAGDLSYYVGFDAVSVAFTAQALVSYGRDSGRNKDETFLFGIGGGAPVGDSNTLLLAEVDGGVRDLAGGKAGGIATALDVVGSKLAVRAEVGVDFGSGKLWEHGDVIYRLMKRRYAPAIDATYDHLGGVNVVGAGVALGL